MGEKQSELRKAVWVEGVKDSDSLTCTLLAAFLLVVVVAASFP